MGGMDCQVGVELVEKWCFAPLLLLEIKYHLCVQDLNFSRAFIREKKELLAASRTVFQQDGSDWQILNDIKLFRFMGICGGD